MSLYLSTEKKKRLMKAFITCHFNYCPLIWMFHSRALEEKINKLHERCLRIVYSNLDSFFEDLLKLDDSSTFHQRAIQLLATELFKSKSNEQDNGALFLKNKCKVNTRKRNSFRCREVESEINGKSSLAFLGPKVWAILPGDIKNSKDLAEFKNKI